MVEFISAHGTTLAIAEYEKNANYELAYIIHHPPNNGGFAATTTNLCCWIHVKKVGIFSCPMDASELLHNNLICL